VNNQNQFPSTDIARPAPDDAEVLFGDTAHQNTEAIDYPATTLPEIQTKEYTPAGPTIETVRAVRKSIEAQEQPQRNQKRNTSKPHISLSPEATAERTRVRERSVSTSQQTPKRINRSRQTSKRTNGSPQTPKQGTPAATGISSINIDQKLQRRIQQMQSKRKKENS
jgi:hypothetical protein